MGYGGFHPYPRRFGGNKYEGKPLLQVTYEAISASRGAAFDTSGGTSIAAIENQAYARAIMYGWETNARLGHQWDARRTTDMLPRWEAIFKIRPKPGTSERARRREIQKRWERFGSTSNHAYLTTVLEQELGDYFVAVEYISKANAVIRVPEAGYPLSWGATVEDGMWYSTVAHILVRLQKPTGATEAQFYEAAGKVSKVLDPVVSAFSTFAWYRPPATGTPVSVSGGPSAGGFYLDEVNLDNLCFSS